MVFRTETVQILNLSIIIYIYIYEAIVKIVTYGLLSQKETPTLPS